MMFATDMAFLFLATSRVWEVATTYTFDIRDKYP